MKKIIKVLMLCFLFSLSLIIIVNAEDNDNVNAGSAAEGYGTIDFDIKFLGMWEGASPISLAKVSLWDNETNKTIDTFIVSNYSIDDLKNVRLMSKLNKIQYINQGMTISDNIIESLQYKDEYDYISKVVTIDNFPECLIKEYMVYDGGNTHETIHNYFGDTNNIQELLNTFNYNGQDDITFLIEPLGLFIVNQGNIDDPQSYYETETVIALSCTELGLLLHNEHPILNIKLTETNAGSYTPFLDYYYTPIFRTMPFSCFKVDIGKIQTIKPIKDKYKHLFTITAKNEYSDMVHYGCFEVYTKLDGTEKEENERRNEPHSYDVEYYTNEWVITNVSVSSSEGFPRQSYYPGTEKDYDAKNGCLNNKLAEITFEFESNLVLNTSRYTQKLAIPPGETTYAWVKWKCPSSPGSVTIKVSSSNEDAHINTETINVRIVDPINGKYPPNPEANDRNDSFIAPTRATGSWNIGTNRTLTWTTYDYSWHYLWVWGCSRTREDGHLTEYGYSSDWDEDYVCEAHTCPDDSENHECPTGRCHGIKEDWGWVEYIPIEHSLTLNTANETLYRSDKTPNTNNSALSVKSGYGINLLIDTYCTYKVNGITKRASTNRGAVVPAQYMEVFLPEHEYKTYEITTFNDLENNGYSDENTFEFPVNPYSQFEQKCHFTPIWYPDGKYVIGTKISQCFCPAGMLTICKDDISININGNAYDDWHIAPKMN